MHAPKPSPTAVVRRARLGLALGTALLAVTAAAAAAPGTASDLDGREDNELGGGRPAAAERFVAVRPAAAIAVGAALELRPEATVVGPEVRLKQVARWSKRDAAFFEQVGDLVLARLDAGRPSQAIDLGLVRRALADAGMNVGRVRFGGPTSMTVTRADARQNDPRPTDAKPADPATALARWIDAAKPAAETSLPAGVAGRAASVETPAGLPAPATTSARETAFTPAAARPTFAPPAAAPFAAPITAPARAELVERAAVRSLREVLTTDLATRLNLPIDQLQIAFASRDERLLSLCEPQFKFDVDPQRVRDLGEVTWGVELTVGNGAAAGAAVPVLDTPDRNADGDTAGRRANGPAGRRTGGSSAAANAPAAAAAQRVTVTATARAWQRQAVVNRPVTSGAPIAAGDVTERRVLADRLPDEPLLTVAQAVGQQAARDLRPGNVLTGRMIEALPMARIGQRVTVTVGQGPIRVTTAALATEAGALGQRIKVRNEDTNDTYDVVLTGPQTATVGG